MFKRNCPQCGCELSYKTKQSFDTSVKKKKLCRSCTVKNEYKKNPEKNKGDSNGRFGISLFDAMIKKYGENEGNIKYEEWKANLHKFGSGKNNPQYGKSPFKNGGRSYHGWYKGLFFRSSFELIFIMENYELDLIPADNGDFRVEYILDEKKFFYHPDFYSKRLNTVYEIKSFEWLKGEKNQIKIKTAIEHFRSLGMNFNVFTEKDMVFFNHNVSGKYKTDIQTFLLICEKFFNHEIILTESSVKRLKNRLIKRKENLKLKKLEEMKNM